MAFQSTPQTTAARELGGDRRLGFRFCPRLRDFPDRRIASIEAPGQYPSLKPLIGARVKIDVIREHWDETVRLVASMKAGTVLPAAMLRKLAAYERQNQLDLALREIGRVEQQRWIPQPFAPMLAPSNTSLCHDPLHLFAKTVESQHVGIVQQLSDGL